MLNLEPRRNETTYTITYPKQRGRTGRKAYFQNEGKIICEDCYENKNNLN